MKVHGTYGMIALTVALVPLSGCKTAPETKAPPADRVHLEFAWPDGATAQVRVHQRIEDRAGKVVTEATSTFRWKVVHRTEEKRLRIETTEAALEGKAATDNLQLVLSRLIGTVLPSFEVADVGDFLGIDETDPLLEAYALAAGMDLDALPPEQLQQIRALVRRAMEEQTRDVWGNLVTFWATRDLEVGRRYTRRSPTEVPLLGGTVDLLIDYQVEGRVPCEAESKEPRCVTLSFRSKPDPEAVARRLQAAGEAASGGAKSSTEAAADAEATGAPKTEGAAAETEASDEGHEEDGEAAEPSTPAEDEEEASSDPAAAGSPAAGGTPAASPAPAAPQVLAFSSVNEAKLVTEPETLRPHRLVRTRQADVKVRLPTGAVVEQHQRTVTTFTFDWER